MPKQYPVDHTSTIPAPRTRVWHELAVRFGEIDQISPGVIESMYVTDQTEGVGTTRRCTLERDGFMLERVTVWEAPERFELVIDDTSMPMDPGAVLTFTLSETGPEHTEVRVDGTYRIAKVGFLSPLARPMFAKTIASILGDLERAATTA